MNAKLIAIAACALSVNASASSLKTLYKFDGVTGGQPTGGVILGPGGVLYGETADGGVAPCNTKHGLRKEGCGTVFTLSSSGVLTVLVDFHGPNGAYGTSGLSLVGSTLLGATINGGTNDDGVIFSVRTDGTHFALIHQFSGTDGYQPIGPLVKGAGGVFYGITSGGGASYPTHSPGVLFSLSPTGSFKVLYTFTASTGTGPTTLLATPTGTLVGSTFYGGPTNKNYCPQGCGVVFSFDPIKSVYNVLQTFDGVTGINPYIGSVGPDGTAYGNNQNLFSISPTGNYVVLAASNPYVGDSPESGPALAPNGSLFGTYTLASGFGSSGTLYSYQNGVLALAEILDFPAAEPIVTPAGVVIGTTDLGGACYSCGTIYAYTP